MSDQSTPLTSFLAPRYWPVWLGLAAMRLGAWLPFRVQQGIGSGLGLLAMRLIKRRRVIAEANLLACFPDKTHALEMLAQQGSALGV
ncbi:MAG: hypothetical protein AAFU65_08580, partial [Pseudomonadota bacterium]